MKNELLVLKRYIWQIFGVSPVMAGFLAVGIGSLSVVPGAVMAMIGISGVTTGNAYDGQDGWGALRLTMPVSRRHVVIGRYATTVLTVLAGAAAGVVLVLVLLGLSQGAKLLGVTNVALHMSAGDWVVLAYTFAACLVVVAAVTGISIPVMFKSGSAAARLAPVYLFLTIMVVCGVLSFVGIDLTAASDAFTAWVTVPGNGMLLFCCLVIVALAIWAASAAVSLKLYAARDL